MKASKNCIKVGFCVAYDWRLLMKSLPLVYDRADTICLSLDKNRRGWSGLKYDFDEVAFQELIKKTDIHGKIDLYEDDFYIPSLTPIENDNRQRELMSKRMGAGGWHIQIDSDEYFLDFNGFVNYLLKIDTFPSGTEKPLNVCCQWVSVFKKVKDGYLIVDNSGGVWESMPFATNHPEYLNARRNSHFNIVSPFFVIHETWSRSSEELKQKLNSWGHDTDFTSKESYFNFWEVLDEFNYKYVDDFHPLKSGVWKKLTYVRANSISELAEGIRVSDFVKVNSFKMFFTNSRNWNRVLALLRKLKIG